MTLLQGDRAKLTSTDPKLPDLHIYQVPRHMCYLNVDEAAEGNGDPDYQFCEWQIVDEEGKLVDKRCPYCQGIKNDEVMCSK